MQCKYAWVGKLKAWPEWCLFLVFLVLLVTTIWLVILFCRRRDNDRLVCRQSFVRTSTTSAVNASWQHFFPVLALQLARLYIFSKRKMHRQATYLCNVACSDKKRDTCCRYSTSSHPITVGCSHLVLSEHALHASAKSTWLCWLQAAAKRSVESCWRFADSPFYRKVFIEEVGRHMQQGLG